ncbi:MAG TPA: helix-turn-helix transcriptional regulator, partial [Gemmatimonadota bacterium]|nr:helix-turn-helix transcriptional regulator [Gemmatimonadota bacterium]
MSDSDARLDELGAFLKARRGELEPADVGLSEGGRTRRVPGLRREEVARLAAISADFYTKIEQGRMAASASTLASLARALRLDDDERAYLFELGGKAPAEAAEDAWREPGKHHLERILDLVAAPAMVTRHNFDILAWNPLAAALMIDFSEVPEPERNFVRLIFTHPAMRSRYPEWEDLARRTVSYLRMEMAQGRGQEGVAELVEELSELDPDFRRLWDEQIVAIKRTG